MAVTFLPYGQLADGKYGVLFDETNKTPLASAIEILTGLPSADASDNFSGRVVFDLSTNKPYVFTTNPLPTWKSIDGVPVTVGEINGNPPSIPLPQLGHLYWNITTEILYVWDGAKWEPIGGRYASTIVENTYTANGVQTIFPTGATQELQSAYVEVFLDGVRQSSLQDYVVIGTAISFNTPPGNGVAVYVRAINSQAIVQSAQITTSNTIANAGQQTVILPGAGADPSGVMVFVDGICKADGIDYTFVRHITTITAFTKTSLTVGRATTQYAHQIPIGSMIKLEGFTETAYNNKVYAVTSIPSPTSFTVDVLPTDPNNGTPNPVMFYSPSYVNDRVTLHTPLVGGETLVTKYFANVVSGSGTGEVNTLTSVGNGQSLVVPKLNEMLRVKSLTPGSNVTIIDTGNELQIAASLGGAFEDRVGINVSNYTVSSNVSYVGVRNTIVMVTINLGGIAQIPANSGRRITIKDESGTAGLSGIQIVGGAALIDGSVNPYVINTNYGYVTMVMDGTNWFIIGRG